MHIFYKKPAFTLLETLLALVILAVVLSASVGLSRGLARQALITSQQSQLNMLADESIEMVKSYRDAYRLQNTSGVGFGVTMDLPDLRPNDVTVTGLFYADPKSYPAFNSPRQEDGGSFELGWCTLEGSAKNCNAAPLVTSPVSSPECGGGGDCKMNQMISANIKNLNGELIGVRKKGYDAPIVCGGSSSSSLRRIVDISNPLSVQASCVSTVSNTGKPNADWDFYVREIKITRGKAGIAADSTFNLNNSTYAVTVSVINYRDPSLTVVKTAKVIDYIPSKSLEGARP